MSEIVLVTRKANYNKGNIALSAAWYRLLREAFPEAAVRTLERGPRQLAGYSLREIAAEPDPIAAFEVIAARMAELAPGPQGVGAPGDHGIVLQEAERPLANLRRRLNLRRYLARAGLDRRAYRQRLAAFQRAALVVMNPAGEFHTVATDLVLIYLLDMRVAQLLGRRTAMVNLSLETQDPALEPLILHVFGKLDLLHFRDEESRQAYASMGGDSSQPAIVPDLALTSPAPSGVKARPGTVALAINGQQAEMAGALEPWVELVERLQEQGLEVALLTNAVPDDRPFYDKVQKRTGIPFLGQGMDTEPFTALLASFELVIAMRMHTGILALAAGRPVIPVESVLFKMTGLFRQLGLPVPAVDSRTEGWVEETLRRVAGVRADVGAAEAETRRRVAEAVERTRSTLIPRLRAAVSERA